jgi:hypothetical protein
MILKEILEKLSAAGEPVLLQDGSGQWKAGELLGLLPAPRLRIEAYLQPGLYIAEISPAGYLGQVLYRLRRPGSPDGVPEA